VINSMQELWADYENDVGLEDDDEKSTEEELASTRNDRSPHWFWARIWRRCNPDAEVWAHIPVEGAPDVPLRRAKALRAGDVGIRVLTSGATVPANDAFEAESSPKPKAKVTNERQLPVFITVEEAVEVLRLPNRKALYAMVERGQVEGVVRRGSRILFDRDAFLHGIRRGSR